MRLRSVLASLVVAICLTAAWWAGALGANNPPRPDSPTLPAQPRILEAAQAPRTAKILRQAALTYAPRMSEKDREIDFLQKVM